ncbi:hypothetical protein LINPERPRIM_LOCUS5782 [Linum perenne]
MTARCMLLNLLSGRRFQNSHRNPHYTKQGVSAGDPFMYCAIP